MPIAADTSPAMDGVQLEAYRRMGGAGRVQVMFRLSQMARRTAEAGIRHRHPEQRLEIPHMVTGSVASSFHGRPRSTHDADVVVDPARGGWMR